MKRTNVLKRNEEIYQDYLSLIKNGRKPSKAVHLISLIHDLSMRQVWTIIKNKKEKYETK